MSYELEFITEALKEWKKLDQTIQQQFKKQLEKRLENPHIPSCRLSGAEMGNVYKIKLRTLGYRLVYEVIDDKIVVLVLAVGKRDKSEVYEAAKNRKV